MQLSQAAQEFHAGYINWIAFGSDDREHGENFSEGYAAAEGDNDSGPRPNQGDALEAAQWYESVQ